MSKFLKISEAAALAFHACSILAENPDRKIQAKEMVEMLDVSYNHLSKVLQRLVKEGIIKSVKGPQGGFTLAVPKDRISLLDIYEAVEGKMELTSCLFEGRICRRADCILGSLVKKVNSDVYEFFKNTRF